MHINKTNNTMCNERDGTGLNVGRTEEFGFLWMCGACENKPTYITIYDLFAHKREKHSLRKESSTTESSSKDDDKNQVLENNGSPLENSNFSNVSSEVEEDVPLSSLQQKCKPLPNGLGTEEANWLLEGSPKVNDPVISEEVLKQTQNPARDLHKFALTDLIPSDSDVLSAIKPEVDETIAHDINDGDFGNDCHDGGKSENEFLVDLSNDQLFRKRKKQHKCKICNEIFDSRKRLSQHKSIHISSETGMFKCEVCGKECGKYDNFTRHIMIHQDDRVKSFTCAYCSSSFYNLADLRRHCLLHADVKPYTCQECGEGFIKQDALNVHMSKHTGILYEKFTCKLCGKILNSPSALAMHSKNHTSKSIFCSEPECSFSCYMKSQLRQHMRRHNGEKPFQCSYCGRCFARSNDMKNHILNVHHRIRPHKCPDCPKEFTLLSSLKTHRLIHLDIRPYLCAECGKRFNHPSTLRKHTHFIHRHLCGPCMEGNHSADVRKKKRSRAIVDPSQTGVKAIVKYSDAGDLKEEAITYADAAVQSLPIVSLQIPIHIPQITLNLDQGYTQAYFIPSVTIPTIVKPESS